MWNRIAFCWFAATAVSIFCAPMASADPQRDSAATGATDDLVRERFFDDYPELRLQWDGLPDWEKVRYLRTWTWSWVDVAFDPNLHESLGENAIQTLELFAKDYGGVWCEGASSSLVQVYREFGFQAHNLSISMVPPASEWGAHVMTLVRINDAEGQPVWSLQDAYFNNCQADARGRPIDYVNFLERLKSGELDQVRMLEMEMPIKEWPAVIVSPDRSRGRVLNELPSEYWPVDLDHYRIEGVPGNWVKIFSPRTAKLYDSRFYYFKEILQANNLPANSILAFLYSDQHFAGDQDYHARIRSVVGKPALKPLPYGKYRVWFSSAGYREIPWRWSNQCSENELAVLEIATPSSHTLHLWMGEPRVPIDQLLLTENLDLDPADVAQTELGEVIVIEAEDAAGHVERSDSYWLLCDRQTKYHSGRGFMVSQPRHRIFEFSRCRDEAPELRYEVDFPRAGKWHLFVRTNTVIPPNDLVHVGVDGNPVFSMELAHR